MVVSDHETNKKSPMRRYVNGGVTGIQTLDLCLAKAAL